MYLVSLVARSKARPEALNQGDAGDTIHDSPSPHLDGTWPMPPASPVPRTGIADSSRPAQNADYPFLSTDRPGKQLRPTISSVRPPPVALNEPGRLPARDNGKRRGTQAGRVLPSSISPGGPGPGCGTTAATRP